MIGMCAWCGEASAWLEGYRNAPTCPECRAHFEGDEAEADDAYSELLRCEETDTGTEDGPR